MKRALGGSFYLAIGVLTGIASAIASVDFLGSAQVAKSSNWRAWDTSSDSHAAFYANAHYLLNGRLPPVPGQIGEMSAERDDTGSLLSASCSYVVKGAAARPGWWSLAAMGTGVTPQASGMLTGDTAIIENDGSLVITVAAQPSPGNWVKSPASGNFQIVFTAAGNGLAGRNAFPLLSITRGDC